MQEGFLISFMKRHFAAAAAAAPAAVAVAVARRGRKMSLCQFTLR